MMKTKMIIPSVYIAPLKERRDVMKAAADLGNRVPLINPEAIPHLPME